MNKKLNIFLAISLLFFSVSSHPIMDVVATSLSAFSWPVYFSISSLFTAQTRNAQRNATAILAIGSIGLSSLTYAALYQFTPQGRLKRANKIIEALKDEYPRIFGSGANDSKDQIMHDLGAFAKMYRDNRNFAILNALDELDDITNKLKRAEHLLLAAKKDIYPSARDFARVGFETAKKDIFPLITNFVKVGFEKLNMQAQSLMRNVSDRMENSANQKLIDLERSIDLSLAKAQEMLIKTAKIYPYVEADGSKEFKDLLNEQEKLRKIRAQNKRQEVANIAITTASAVGSVVALLISGAIFIRACKWKPAKGASYYGTY